MNKSAQTSLIGQVFGYWKVLEDAPSKKAADGKYKRYSLCECKCGTKREVLNYDLKTGKSKSCGCLSVELLNERTKTHGLTYSRAYASWCNMKQRITNENNPDSIYYEGKSLCARWETFQNFFEDMGHPPPGMTIERVDNDGDYCKENCVWATRKVQARNTRRAKRFTILGFSGGIGDLAEHFGINYFVLYSRLVNLKWDPVRAVTEPVRTG